ncbi:hypothetical protein GLE_4222 [Lysobacter enzymogenes]|uniref:Uncharacterized protein n=1 Tax=Lysobacter enzymogenes TaxID=69 RepID=A0A0S2DLJ7_LYSEN|nr:hypothetical protein GLE_4222 [Lysobacter enzymogenes]
MPGRRHFRRRDSRRRARPRRASTHVRGVFETISSRIGAAGYGGPPSRGPARSGAGIGSRPPRRAC